MNLIRMPIRTCLSGALALISVACTTNPGSIDESGTPGEKEDSASRRTPHILILDFRSGWWAGSAGEFHRSVLGPLREDGGNITIEFHHMTVGSDFKCIYSPTKN